MKKQILMLMMAVVVLVGVGVSAQAQPQQTWKASIPYQFVVGDKTLPAGDYTLRIVNPSSDRPVLQLENAAGKGQAMIQTMATNGKLQNEASILFREYAGHHFFAGLRFAGDSTGLATSRGRRERELRRELVGKTDRKESTVAVKIR